MEATIQYQDLKTGEEVGIARSDPRTGRYQISLPYGIHYGFQAEALGYVSIGENIDLSKVGKYKEMTKNLYLAPIKVGETVNLKNVFFKVATAKLLKESMPELERVAHLMNENPTLEIKIKGHTDSLGKPDVLLRLSRERARAVWNYLVHNHSIKKSRISWEGYGGSKPIVDNRNPKERYKNRRVEFEIIKY
ncbi:MAG: OmpA family protein [Flammeovirgaceae bacterium]